MHNWARKLFVQQDGGEDVMLRPRRVVEQWGPRLDLTSFSRKLAVKSRRGRSRGSFLAALFGKFQKVALSSARWSTLTRGFS